MTRKTTTLTVLAFAGMGLACSGGDDSENPAPAAFEMAFQGSYNGESFSQTCGLVEDPDGAGDANVGCAPLEIRCGSVTSEGTEITVVIDTSLANEPGAVYDFSMCEQGCQSGVSVHVDGYPYTSWSGAGAGNDTVSPVNEIAIQDAVWREAFDATFEATFERMDSSDADPLDLSVSGTLSIDCSETADTADTAG